LRGAFEGEREELSVELAQGQMELTQLRAAFGRERAELKSNLESREDELAEVRAESGREHDALKERIEALEAKRAELRSAFDRISQLGVQPAASEQGDGRSGADRPREPQSAPVQSFEENSAVVPKQTLRQARAQFEFLARECVRRGDVATQAMCELGAHSIDLALVTEAQPASMGEALNILGPILRPGPGSSLGPHPTPHVSGDNFGGPSGP
jgi:hypothetical protein